MFLDTRQQEYHDYIHSQQWFSKRQQAFEHHGKSCKKCGSVTKLHVHHLTYKHFKNERVETELVPLCRSCHERCHQFCNKQDMNLYHGTLAFLEMKIVQKSKGGSSRKKKKKAGFVKLTKEQIRRRKQKQKNKQQKKIERKKDKVDRKQKNRKELESNLRRLEAKQKSTYDIQRFMTLYNVDEATAQDILSRV